MIITLFKNIKQTNTPYHIDVYDVLNRIATGKSKDKINAIRNAEDKKQRNELKKGLPSICFSGTFRERSAKKLIKYSGLICLDFDEFENEKELLNFKEAFSKDKFVFSCFISPSGNGLKVLVKVPVEKHNHKKYFEALYDYFDTPNLDVSGSDVSRACFESYDPNIYINKESEVFNEILDTKEYEYHNVKEVKVPLKNEAEIIRRLDKWWNKNYGFVLGERNKNLFVLACAFSEFGVSESSCRLHSRQFVSKDFKREEIEKTIWSAYKKTKHSFDTKYFEDTDLSNYVTTKVLSGTSEQELEQELLKKGYDNEDIYTLISEAKDNESIDVFWTINPKTKKVTIIAKRFKDYLRQEGFYKYYPEGAENYVFVRVESNLIDFTYEDRIKTFVLDKLEREEQFEVYEYLAKTPKYFKEDFLNIIDTIKVSMKKDTKDTSYCYYRNCVVEVTKKGINQIDYIDLDGYVWRDRVIDREFKLSSNIENDYKKFISKVAGEDEINIASFQSTIGYLLHGFKKKSYSPATILNDETISSNPEGGTGKGLFVCALEHLKKVTILNGKSFDPNKSFPYQTVTTSTQILVFDDVKKNFKFEDLFSIITEGITLEKKNKDAIKIDFYNSPKVIISTNYAIKGKGNSHDRRRWELEFAQYYKKSFTPEDEFGKMLFDDWTKEEWLAFDNYMIKNIQYYLLHGFSKPNFKNLEVRKLINETSFEFFEWAEDSQNDLIRKPRVSKAELFDAFVLEYQDYKKWLSRKAFLGWIKNYADFKGQEYDEGNTNGTRWCDLGFKEEDLTEKELEQIPF